MIEISTESASVSQHNDNLISERSIEFEQGLGREETANLITHAGGFLLAVVGAIYLLNAIAGNSNGLLVFGCWVYALGLVAVYGASSLSHMFANPSRRSFFRRVDQGVIFLFIASCFTPFAIVYLHGNVWMTLLGVMWVVALIGFCSKLFWGYRVEATAVTHYLVLGWLPVTAAEPILRSLSMGGFFWSLGGGLCFTIGTIFLWNDSKHPSFHPIWHLLVVAGSYCHYVVITDYVILHQV